MKTEEFLQAYKGRYSFISPYHKKRKLLPFSIIGQTFNPDYPIEVTTVQYRGWDSESITTGYSIESLLQKIESGFLIKSTL
jgi:hypothetical protein